MLYVFENTSKVAFFDNKKLVINIVNILSQTNDILHKTTDGQPRIKMPP